MATTGEVRTPTPTAENTDLRQQTQDLETARSRVLVDIADIHSELDQDTKDKKIAKLIAELIKEFRDNTAGAEQLRNAITTNTVTQNEEVKKIPLKSTMTKLFEVVKGKLFTKEILQKVVTKLSGIAEEQDTVSFLNRLIQNLDIDTGDVLLKLAAKGADEETSSFFHDLINRLAHPEENQRMKIELAKPGEPQTKFEKYFEKLKKDDPKAARLLGQSIIEAARARGGIYQGLDFNDPNVRQRFELKDDTSDELADLMSRNQREGNDKTKLDKIALLIKDDLDSAKDEPNSEIFRTASRSLRLVNSLGSVSTITKFYEDEVKLEQGSISNPTEEQLAEIAKRTTKNIHNTILYITNTIYRNVLNDQNEPSEEFRQAASASDPYYNPNVLYKFFNDRLVSLKSSSAREIDKQSVPFFIYKREINQVYDPELRQDVKHMAITPELQKSNIEQFLTELEAISNTELGLLEYGYNFRLLTLHGSRQEGQRLFKNIATYAFDKATSDSFDRIKALQDSELITVAQTSLMTHMFSMLAKKGHVKSRELTEELFTREGKLLATVADELTDKYSHIDTWRRTRALRHAMTRVFGAEFMFQMVMSYADPASGFVGQEDIGGKNSVFSWQELAIRWASFKTHDLNFKGGIFAPSEGKIDDYDHIQVTDAGEAIWKSMFKNGLTSCFLDKHFWNKDDKGRIKVILPEIATPGNVTETGGPNAFGGWRVRRPLIPLMQKYMEQDPRHEYKVKFDKNKPGTFTNMWKSIENSGVNNIRVIMNGDFLDDEFLKMKDINSWEQKTEYEHLLKFMYRRYFSNGIGKSFAVKIQSENDYWNSITDKISKNPKNAKDVLRSEMHNAMTVMIYERTPLEFFYKSKARDEQNGVTTWVQTKEAMMENLTGNDQEKEKQWDDANNYLEYVQMETRQEVTKEINKRRKEEQWNDSNIFGKSIEGSDYSDVRNRKGYVIDADTIREVLIKKLLGRERKRDINDPQVMLDLKQEYSSLSGDNEIKKRVEQTVQLHTTLTKVLQEKPRENELETIWKDKNHKDYDMKKYDLARQWKKTKINWFSEAWQKNMYGGIPFILDKDWVWETEALGDRNTVSRVAGSVAVTAEEVNYRRTDRGAEDAFIILCKDSVRKGATIWPKFKSYISGFKKTIGDEVPGEITTKVGRQEVRRMLLMMVRDDYARNMLGEVYSMLERRNKSSIAADAWTNYIAKDFDANDIRSFLRVLVQDGALKPDEAEGLAAEFSATKMNVLGEWGPKIGLIFFAVLLAQYLKEAYEEEVEKA